MPRDQESLIDIITAIKRVLRYTEVISGEALYLNIFRTYLSVIFEALILIKVENLEEVIPMNIRETTVTKLQQLPESLLQEVSDFIDLVSHQHQSRTSNNQSESNAAEVWAKWFEAVDCLDVTPTEPASNYQQLLLNKYRQQGLDL